MADPVSVTGLGLVTPAGIGVDASWERVVAGQSAAATLPELDGLPVDCVLRGRDRQARADRPRDRRGVGKRHR